MTFGWENLANEKVRKKWFHRQACELNEKLKDKKKLHFYGLRNTSNV